jgi:uncharacterized protein YggT (Ycf19 family)
MGTPSFSSQPEQDDLNKYPSSALPPGQSPSQEHSGPQGVIGSTSQSYMIGDTYVNINDQMFVDADGNIVQRRNAVYENPNQRRANLRKALIAFVSFLTSVLVTLLLIRFFLLLFGANASNSFVAFIYRISQPFLLKFTGTFGTHPVGQHGIFEPSTLVAIAMYLILSAGIQAAIRLALADKHDPQQESTTVRRMNHW